MSGTNGTSIRTRGTVANASKRGNGTAALTNGTTITLSNGDAVVQADNGHLYQWITEGNGTWVDLGQFKGEPGKTYYTHIAWATDVTYSGTTVTNVTGFATDKSPNDTTHVWMGVYIDENSGQDSSNALLYTWSYVKGVDGLSVQAQYASTGNPTSSQIHSTWQSGDLYMRTLNNGTWSPWYKIIGENGNETNYSFAISAVKTTANASTAPSDISSWSDAPVATTASKPYLWSRVQKKVWDASQQQYTVASTSYIRLTGEEGESGAVASATPDKISIPCNADGSVSESMQVGVTLALNVGTHQASIASVAVVNGSLPSGVSVTLYPNVVITIGTSANASDLASGVTFIVTGVYGGKTYYGQITVALIGSEKGSTGQRGKLGRFFYYAQQWENSNTVRFIVTDAQAPYFFYNNGYFVFNPESNYPNGITMHDMGVPTSSNPNWKQMTNDFKYIITEAIFGQYANFGSAIISGDWLISTNGTIDGVEHNNGEIVTINNVTAAAYTFFDPQHPADNNNGENFVPNYAVDLLTGASYQQNAFIKGGVTTIGRDTRIDMRDGQIAFFGRTGVPNIVLGLDEDGCAVLKFYDKDGKYMYDLGPNKIVEQLHSTNSYFMQLEPPMGMLTNISLTDTWSHATEVLIAHTSTKTYHRFYEGYAALNGTIQHYNISGTSAPSPFNGRLYDSKSLSSDRSDAIPNGTNISDGLYVGVEVEHNAASNVYLRRVFGVSNGGQSIVDSGVFYYTKGSNVNDARITDASGNPIGGNTKTLADCLNGGQLPRD